MTPTRPRILLVKPVLPYPPNQGTRVVSFELIQGLSSMYDVTVLTRLMDPSEAAQARELERFCHRVITVLAPNRRSTLTRIAYRLAYGLRSMFTKRSLKSLYDCPGVFVDAARKLASENFDAIVVEYWQLYPLFDVFDPDRTVLLTHDIDYQVNRQVALLERSIPRKVRLVRRWMKERSEEIGAYRRCRRVLALTASDAGEVRRSGCAHVDVLPFGIDVPEPAPGDRSPDEILFLGALGAAFNRDALVYFVRSVIPHLEDTPMRFTIVGGDLPREVSYFARDPRVSVVGRVDDVAPYLARATCMVIPMRYGGGLRIRILEAMAAGLPIVCTTVAIAGMNFQPERDYLLGDSPVEMAGQIRRLLGHPELASALSLGARAHVAAAYGREGCRKRLRQLFEPIVNK